MEFEAFIYAVRMTARDPLDNERTSTFWAEHIENTINNLPLTLLCIRNGTKWIQRLKTKVGRKWLLRIAPTKLQPHCFSELTETYLNYNIFLIHSGGIYRECHGTLPGSLQTGALSHWDTFQKTSPARCIVSRRKASHSKRMAPFSHSQQWE